MTSARLEKRRLRTAVHESGHAIGCTVLGGRIAKAVIIDPPGRGLYGQTAFRKVPEGGMAQVMYAGPYSEARWLHGPRPSQSQVWDVLADSGSRDYAELMAAGGTAFGVGITALLERCWDPIRSLARQLHRVGEINHDDVLSALHLTAQTAPMGLSMIRSGCAPGTFTITRPPPDLSKSHCRLRRSSQWSPSPCR